LSDFLKQEEKYAIDENAPFEKRGQGEKKIKKQITPLPGKGVKMKKS